MSFPRFLPRVLALAGVLLSLSSFASAQVPFSSGREALQSSAMLPRLSVQGNRFVDPAGKTVILRGVAASDPAALLARGHWGRRYFEAARSWNANVIRIPIHPAEWRKLGEENYLKLLDDAVRWSGELGMYVIIDWHVIGNLLTGVYHRPIYITSRDETFRFWHTIAERYKGVSTIALYELYNEPTNRNGQMGRLPWTDYKAFIEDLIYMLREIDPACIPLVAGFDWAYDLSPIRDQPIDFPGIAYVTHPYPQKRDNWEESWERDWGFAAKKYPVVATEFGFMSADGPGAHNPVIADETYGEAIIAFFEKRGISWTPWVFDAQWSPQLLADWDYNPAPQGRFFRAKMEQLNK